MKLLLDTGVLADFYLQREEFSKNVNSIIVAGICGDVELWASAKSYMEIFSIGKKHFESSVLQNAFLESFKFVHVCALEKDDLANAARECWPNFEDCLIHKSAIKANADFIVTYNAEAFAASEVKTATPQKIVDILTEKGFRYAIVSV